MIKERYLITGGLGFIGSNLIRNLSNLENISICNIDKVSYSSSKEALKGIEIKNYEFKKINIVNTRKVTQIINEFKPSYIIHLAADTSVQVSAQNERNFLIPQLNLLDIAEVMRSKNIIIIFKKLKKIFQI